MSTTAREKAEKPKVKRTDGWAAFDLKQRREWHGLAPKVEAELYPSLVGAVPSGKNVKSFQKPFSSVLTAPVSFPPLTDATKKSDKMLQVADSCLSETQGNVIAPIEGEGDQAIESYQKLNKLHPWADESLIKDVMASVNNDFNKALTFLGSMTVTDIEDAKEKLLESKHVNCYEAPASSTCVPLEETRCCKFPNNCGKEMLDHYVYVGQMHPYGGAISNFVLDASSVPIEPEWVEEDVYSIHRKEAIRMMRSAARHSKAATDAYFRGDHLSAQHFSVKAGEEWAAAERLNANAAKEILNIRNCKNDQWTLDLHGLHAAEAVIALQERLEKVESIISFNHLTLHNDVNKESDTLHSESLESVSTSGIGLEKVGKQHISSRQTSRSLQVITGKGNHSRGEAALPSAVKNFLIGNGYHFDEGRPGMITVRLKFRQQ